MDKMFDDFRRQFDDTNWMTPYWKSGWNEGAYLPKVDMSEDASSVHLTAEMPGLTANDVNVTYNNNMLTIRGEKKTEKEHKEKQYTCRERSYGTFSRSLMLPCEIEVDRVEATFRDGLLTLHMPKTQAAKSATKEIKIK